MQRDRNEAYGNVAGPVLSSRVGRKGGRTGRGEDREGGGQGGGRTGRGEDREGGGQGGGRTGRGEDREEAGDVPRCH